MGSESIDVHHIYAVSLNFPQHVDAERFTNTYKVRLIKFFISLNIFILSLFKLVFSINIKSSYLMKKFYFLFSYENVYFLYFCLILLYGNFFFLCLGVEGRTRFETLSTALLNVSGSAHVVHKMQKYSADYLPSSSSSSVLNSE